MYIQYMYKKSMCVFRKAVFINYIEYVCLSRSHTYTVYIYIHTYILIQSREGRHPSPYSADLTLTPNFYAPYPSGEEWDLASKIWLKPLLVPLEDSSVLRFSILWIPAKPSIKLKPAMEIVENTGK